jgi:hypothetical protein
MLLLIKCISPYGGFEIIPYGNVVTIGVALYTPVVVVPDVVVPDVVIPVPDDKLYIIIPH